MLPGEYFFCAVHSGVLWIPWQPWRVAKNWVLPLSLSPAVAQPSEATHGNTSGAWRTQRSELQILITAVQHCLPYTRVNSTLEIPLLPLTVSENSRQLGNACAWSESQQLSPGLTRTGITRDQTHSEQEFWSNHTALSESEPTTSIHYPLKPEVPSEIKHCKSHNIILLCFVEENWSNVLQFK